MSIPERTGLILANLDSFNKPKAKSTIRSAISSDSGAEDDTVSELGQSNGVQEETKKKNKVEQLAQEFLETGKALDQATQMPFGLPPGTMPQQGKSSGTSSPGSGSKGGSSGGGKAAGGKSSSTYPSGNCGQTTVDNAWHEAASSDSKKIEGYDPSADSGNRIKELTGSLGVPKAYSDLVRESAEPANQKKVYGLTFTREDGECINCNELKPSLEGPAGIPAKFDSKHFAMYKVDPSTREGAALAKQLGVKGWPTTLVIQNGKVLDKVEGNNPQAITNMIASELPLKQEMELAQIAEESKAQSFEPVPLLDQIETNLAHPGPEEEEESETFRIGS